MSQTVTIPGGEAVLLASDELTARRRRPIELISTRLGRKLPLIQKATRLLVDGDVITDQSHEVKEDGTPKFTGGDVHLTENDLALMARLNDVAVLALLKSWTLDRPLPTTEDELGDLPVPIFDALREAAGQIVNDMDSGDSGFTVDAVEDLTSPTGD